MNQLKFNRLAQAEYPETRIRPFIVHMVRHSLRYVSWSAYIPRTLRGTWFSSDADRYSSAALNNRIPLFIYASNRKIQADP